MEREEILLAQLCRRLLGACADIRGIILFGSFARRDRDVAVQRPYWQDVDLLVILGRQVTDRRACDRLVIELREALGPDAAGVDLVVVHEEGVRWGLEAHYPFYLNVAFDGEVLYDGNGIADLLEQARRDVEARRIRRTETGGWQFPVPYRRRVPLSPFDNVTWARRWLDDGERDLQAAEGLFRLGLHERSVTHSQQAVEKSVKAVLACMGWMERRHYLASRLRGLIPTIQDIEWREQLEALVNAAAEMEPAAVDSRYPVEMDERVIWPQERYGQMEATRALDLARQSLETGRSFVQWWANEEEEHGT